MRKYRNTFLCGATEDKQDQSLFKRGLSALLVLGVVYAFFSSYMPFGFLHFWKSSGTVSDWFMAGLPFFGWALGVNMLFYFRKSPGAFGEIGSPGEMLSSGFILSLIVGLYEEVCARWLIFFSAIIGVKISNFILLGFIDFGLVELFHNYVVGPLANFTTFGYLKEWIFHPDSWAIGAGMLLANATFRDGHAYQGLFGWLNSWFIGMFLFWIMFTYGLWAAIFVHFMYDFMIFGVFSSIVALFKHDPLRNRSW